MTVKRRLIPKLLLTARQGPRGVRPVLVTTVQFGQITEVGDPVSQARVLQDQVADELIFLDIDASHDRGELLRAVVQSVAEEVFMPLAVGGGVRTVEDFRSMLRSGADKVCLNTGAVDDPDTISAAADEFGAQAVVVSIDHRGSGNDARVWVDGTRRETALDPVAWAVEAAARGAGEILLTSIDRDGMMRGLDVATVRRVVDAVGVPVIAAGGFGLAAHAVEVLVEGGADAVAAGTFFSFSDENPMQVRSQISNGGVPIRLHT